MAVGCAPTVLHLPLDWIALVVEIDSSEGHGVCRTRIECSDTVGLVHRECGREERCVVVVLSIRESTLTVKLLAYVVRRIHLLAVLERSDSQLCNLIHRQVEVLPVGSVVHVAVVLYLVCLVIRTTRVVHHHDECALNRVAHYLVVERLRCEAARLAYGTTVLVAELVCEFLHRLAICHREHTIDGREHLGLAVGNGLWLLAGSHHAMQLKSILAKLRREQRTHLCCILGSECLGLSRHRNESVLRSEVGYTTECTAIVERTLEEELHTWVVYRLLGVVDDTLKHKVGLLKLVVEEEIVVREVYAQ